MKTRMWRYMILVSVLITFVFLAGFNDGLAQTVDPSFNPTDIGFGFSQGHGASFSSVYSIAVQNDGKIIIGGGFTLYNGTSRNRIARLNADGTLDGSFNPGTGVSASVFSSAIQSDGKIIIGGNFTSYNGTAINSIARLNADGSIDGTFIVGTGINGSVNTISIQSDGKIIIGGNFTFYNGTAINSIARLNADGSIDGTFIAGTGVSGNFVSTIAIQSDGKIIINGNFTSYNGTARNHIARLNADGGLDITFNPGAGANDAVFTTATQSDGKIIIGGNFISYNGIAINRIARLNADGSLDETFMVGTGANGRVNTISIQSDGKIFIGGYFTSYNGTARDHIARLNTDGSIDGTFIEKGPDNNDVFTSSIQPDGKIIIGGDFYYYAGRNRIARLNADGGLDITFNPETGASGAVHTSAIQNDGKIIIGGDFTSYNGAARNHIARLNTDGSLDETFIVGTGINGTLSTISIQSDGKIIIGGGFTLYNGTARNDIARLNADGSIDETFIVGIGANSTVHTSSIQSNGKIIIGGTFYSNNGTAISNTVRLNADGTLDVSFNPTASAGSAYTISIQSDGKIIIGGFYTVGTLFNVTYKGFIIRLNADGSFDGTFNVGTGPSETVYTSSIQTDGKIIIGGKFSFYNGTATRGAARLNANGSLDGTFNLGTVYTSSIQSDGKIIIGGAGGVARLNADGSIDGTFNVGTGTNGTVLTSAIQSDGKIIIGGYFTAHNGIGRNRIARLCLSPSITSTIPARRCDTGEVALGATASSGTLSWYTTQTGGTSLETGTSFTTPSINSTTTFYVEATNNGCTSARTAVIATIDSTPTITGAPSVGRCDSGPVVLTATNSLGSIVGTLNWYADLIGGTSLRTGTSFTTPSIAVTTTYYVDATNNGCTSSPRTAVVAMINAAPNQPTVTANNSNPSSPVLTSSSATGNQWFRNEVEIDGATENSFTVTQPGIYSVQVTLLGCPSEMSVGQIFIITGLENKLNSGSAIFPNPAHDQITFSLNEFEKDKPVSIRVSDAHGRLIMVTAGLGQCTLTLDVQHYAPGNYFVVLHQGHLSVTEQFIRADK